jgi:hypothetical protein
MKLMLFIIFLSSGQQADQGIKLMAFHCLLRDHHKQ